MAGWGAPSSVPVRLARRARRLGSAAERPPEPYRTACAAPSIQLRFDPNGLVTTCCKSLQPLGHIGANRLPEIWAGHVRREVATALADDDFSVGCQRCGVEISQEGRAISYAAIHDEWAGHLTTDAASRAWPVRMELNLSNACNLQCIQCDGDSSSAIRLHREGRPALPKVYGDQFFEDLVPFLPHLDRMVFAGGEPFLGAENFRVWDLIAELAPDLDCMVVTNATQWTPRIERLLERIRFSFVFSLDGISRETYESIRIGADFGSVMANVDRFCEYAARVGTTVSVNHCLMPQNVHEFADLLLWAEDRAMHVDVSVVRTPSSASIPSQEPAVIQRAHELLEAADPRVRDRLVINRACWDGERQRLARWASGAEAPTGSDVQTVLWFRSAGSGPYDDGAARAELRAWAPDDRVHAVAVGADDRIRRCEVSAIDATDDLVGAHFQELTKAVVAQFGDMVHYEVVATGDDRVDARARFGATPARITTVARRDEAGWADEAILLLAFGGVEGG